MKRDEKLKARKYQVTQPPTSMLFPPMKDTVWGKDFFTTQMIIFNGTYQWSRTVSSM